MTSLLNNREKEIVGKLLFNVKLGPAAIQLTVAWKQLAWQQDLAYYITDRYSQSIPV